MEGNKNYHGIPYVIPTIIDSLLYADDISFIADSHNKMQKLVNNWVKGNRKTENGDDHSRKKGHDNQ